MLTETTREEKKTDSRRDFGSQRGQDAASGVASGEQINLASVMSDELLFKEVVEEEKLDDSCART